MIWKPGLVLLLVAPLFTGCIVDRDNANTEYAASAVSHIESVGAAKATVADEMRAFCRKSGCAEHLIDAAFWLMEEISSGRWDTTPEKRPNLRPELRRYLDTYTDMDDAEIEGVLRNIEPSVTTARKTVRHIGNEGVTR